MKKICFCGLSVLLLYTVFFISMYYAAGFEGKIFAALFWYPVLVFLIVVFAVAVTLYLIRNKKKAVMTDDNNKS